MEMQLAIGSFLRAVLFHLLARAIGVPDGGSHKGKLLACGRTGNPRGGENFMRSVPAALMVALAFAVMPSGAVFGQVVIPAPPASDPLALLKKPVVFYVARG